MRRTAGSGRRGAVILETALMAPLLLAIVFGIAEMAFLGRDDAALSSLVHDGGHSAAAALTGHREQSRQASPYCASPCSVENAPELADVAASAIENADVSLPKDAIDELWVYRANAQGYPGVAGNTEFGSCVSACVVYRWSPERHAFEYVRGTWLADDISACQGALDSVGVYLKATHSLRTGLFDHDIEISDHAVFSFEPLAAGVCSARS
jgi:hypothetical protein